MKLNRQQRKIARQLRAQISQLGLTQGEAVGFGHDAEALGLGPNPSLEAIKDAMQSIAREAAGENAEVIVGVVHQFNLRMPPIIFDTIEKAAARRDMDPVAYIKHAIVELLERDGFMESGEPS